MSDLTWRLPSVPKDVDARLYIFLCGVVDVLRQLDELESSHSDKLGPLEDDVLELDQRVDGLHRELAALRTDLHRMARALAGQLGALAGDPDARI